MKRAIERVGVCETVIDPSLVKKESTESRFQILDAVDFMGIEFPPRLPIVEPFLCGQGTAMIFGSRGVGKTFVSLGLAIAIASGKAFLKWNVPEPKGVLFIDGELPGPLLQERITQTVNTLDCDPAAPLRILTPDLQENGTPNIYDLADQDSLCDELGDVEVVILDNLSTLCRGGKENNADDWQDSQDFMLRLRRMGKSVVMVHHAGKGGSQRGTSKREDILDTVIALKRPADYSPEEGARFEVHYEKNRGFFGSEAEPFLAQLDMTENGVLEWTVQNMEESRIQQVARLFNDEGLTVTEVANELGIHKSNASRAIKKAREQGLIHE